MVMHSLGSICAFHRPVFANILFMLLHLRSCQFLIHHSWHLPWAGYGRETKPLLSPHEIRKISQCTCERGFWQGADDVRTCACKCSLHRVRHKWNVVDGGSSSEHFNQYPCCQWGWGPLAPASQVKWLWCEMTGAFTEAVLPFPSLSFPLSLTHTPHCSYPH